MTTIEIITQALRDTGDPKFEALADEIERVEEHEIEHGPDIFSGRLEERQPRSRKEVRDARRLN